MSSPPPATTSVEALDGATLAKVYAHLEPRDIVRVSAASKHLASAADEPLFRELFAQAWDEPAWPVASYRDLFLARHRATVAASAVDPAPMMASVESLAALKRGDAKGASTAHLADDARWGVVAAHAEELARAVNASETIDRTDRTIDAANVVRGLHRWLIELTTMAHARRRCLAGEAWWPTSGNRAMLAVSRALSACLTRCPRVRDALLADETQTRSRTGITAVPSALISPQPHRSSAKSRPGWRSCWQASSMPAGGWPWMPPCPSPSCWQPSRLLDGFGTRQRGYIGSSKPTCWISPRSWRWMPQERPCWSTYGDATSRREETTSPSP